MLFKNNFYVVKPINHIFYTSTCSPEYDINVNLKYLKLFVLNQKL